MARRKKSENDDAFNRTVGERVRLAREACDWTLADLGERLGISVSHVKALESGTYSFNAPLLSSLAHTFGEPIAHFVGPDPRPTTAKEELTVLFDTLSQRHRSVLIDIARRLGEMGGVPPGAARSGKIIALEGIDGALLRRLGARLSSLLDADHCDHDYDSHLWRHMVQSLEAKSDGAPDRTLAYERTLFFALERLHRQTERVEPALVAGRNAVVPFGAMASSVYQEAEGVGDRRLIDILETLLLKPDVVVIVRSSPEEAAKKAVLRRPENEGEFYAALRRPEDFAHAQRLYEEKIAGEFAARGYGVRSVDAGSTMSEELVRTALDRIADVVPAAASALARLSKHAEKVRIPAPDPGGRPQAEPQGRKTTRRPSSRPRSAA